MIPDGNPPGWDFMARPDGWVGDHEVVNRLGKLILLVS